MFGLIWQGHKLMHKFRLKTYFKVSGISITDPKNFAERTIFTLCSKISHIPAYLRIGTVEVDLFTPKPRFDSKCKIFLPILQQLKPAFDKCSLVLCAAIHSRNSSHFSTSDALFNYLSKQMLSIFDHCAFYKFEIGFRSDKKAFTNFLSMLLEIPAVAECARLEFLTINWFDKPPSLPISAISKWLRVEEQAERRRNERFLSIRMFSIGNISALIESIKMVSKIIKLTFPSKFLWLEFSFSLRTWTIARSKSRNNI